MNKSLFCTLHPDSGETAADFVFVCFPLSLDVIRPQSRLAIIADRRQTLSDFSFTLAFGGEQFKWKYFA